LEKFISTCCCALRARFLGQSLPRVASRSALPHPGLFLCGAPRRKNRPDKYQQVLKESSQKPKQCQCNFTEIQLSERGIKDCDLLKKVAGFSSNNENLFSLLEDFTKPFDLQNIIKKQAH
jgi:hypothetical protein